MKRCIVCNAALHDAAITCDLCGHAQNPPDRGVPVAPRARHHGVEEYTLQYRHANLACALAVASGLVAGVHAVFVPSMTALVAVWVFTAVVLLASFWKVYLRAKVAEMGYSRAELNAWEWHLKKDAAATMLLAVAVAALLLALLGPTWYEQVKQGAVLLPYAR